MLINKITEATKYINENTDYKPKIGLILGSGLGILADEIEEANKLKYESIPNFPQSTVEGHEGQLVFGKLQDKAVVAMLGSFHCDEGYSMEEVTFLVRRMKALGVDTNIATMEHGGSNKKK